MLSQHRRRRRQKIPKSIVKRQYDGTSKILCGCETPAAFFERGNLKLLVSQQLHLSRESLGRDREPIVSTIGDTVVHQDAQTIRPRVRRPMIWSQQLHRFSRKSRRLEYQLQLGSFPRNRETTRVGNLNTSYLRQARLARDV